MHEPFMIPVEYKGVERAFEAELRVRGYTHQFYVMVDGVEVVYDRDEEGYYRAVVAGGVVGKEPDIGLLKAIAEAIEDILR